MEGGIHNLDHVQTGDEGVRSPANETVEYVLPVTSCYTGEGDNSVNGGENGDYLDSCTANLLKDEASFRDFALLLRVMIRAHSQKKPSSDRTYNYSMHAIAHPHVKKYRPPTPGDDPNGADTEEEDVALHHSTEGFVDLTQLFADMSSMTLSLTTCVRAVSGIRFA